MKTLVVATFIVLSISCAFLSWVNYRSANNSKYPKSISMKARLRGIGQFFSMLSALFAFLFVMIINI